MPPSNTTAGTDPSIRSRDQGAGDRPASTITEAQMALLTALRKVIIPLVQTAVPNSQGLDDVPIGREAEDLLAALQNYISSVIRNGTNTRVVDLTDFIEAPETGNGAEMDPQEVEDVGGEPDSSIAELDSPKNCAEGPTNVVTNLPIGNINEQYEIQLKESLTILREHVYNNLPIRLLYFQKSESDNSKLEITLLDRTQVYSYLEQKFLKQLGPSPKEIPAAYTLPAEHWPYDNNRYAILSHTWLRSAPEGYRKLVNFCRVAEADYGISLGWMDTVCIDKSSSSELDESIRSMYKWYTNAGLCITYLADSSLATDLENDRWFTRGWTLQELLASRSLKFYNRSWKRLTLDPNDQMNKNMQQRIQNATGIPSRIMGIPHFVSAESISNRMQWAAKRQVTRGEDTAYSLMGLFGVNMSIAYGEGAERAFFRLVNEILNTMPDSNVLDIFNFGGGSSNSISKLLPATPSMYLDGTDFKFSRGPLTEPMMLTHLGLRIPVLLLPAAPGAPSSGEYTPYGNYFADPVSYTILDVKTLVTASEVQFNMPTCVNVLDATAKEKSFGWVWSRNRLIVAILNCSAAPEDTDIRIPVKCLAALYTYQYEIPKINATTNLQKIRTQNPITFHLRSKVSQAYSEEFYTIPQSELARHGMQFLTMYL
ncbi:hypothetical protein BDN70DRAFT_929352 [Pholiota conissans]|uniref:Heterokaryon incompatibility domain-containing protein n=1 Tax=Pholiota conissans TaxID=109636 RepID=A0A9P6D4R2_9AGAR|nr:hypothetical protein BDN70DRAFT_929352 [Pholiota conissans]